MVKKATKKPKLTDEEKKRMWPAIRQSWEACAQDIDEGMIPERSGSRRVSAIVELATDANRAMSLGGMSRKDDERLTECYWTPDTQKWLREMFKNY